MNIKEVNENILKEATKSLRIINGDHSELVLPDGTLNFDLNTDNYWENFINQTDSIELPLLNISSMVKSQSIWFRNEGIQDTCTVELVSDYQHNIIEFINRDGGNTKLDFDSLSTLIFVIEITFINSVGWLTKQPIFLGRASIETNNTSQLTLNLSGLMNMANYNTFDDVIESPYASNFNFISLKNAFENILNTPHGLVDEYSYGVTPFILNDDTYLPSDYEGFEENPQLLSTDEVYAESEVLGNDLKYNVFFYRFTAECGWIEKNLNGDGSVINQNKRHTNSLRLFTNQDSIQDIPVDNDDGIARKKLYENVFRCFRPIKTFVANENVSSFEVGEINIQDVRRVERVPANTTEYNVEVGNEILVLEQCMDYKIGSDDTLTQNILFNSVSNIFYYNLTKDIMYWTPITEKCSTVPFPKQWLDMSDYTGFQSRYDIQEGSANYISRYQRFLTGLDAMCIYNTVEQDPQITFYAPFTVGMLQTSLGENGANINKLNACVTNDTYDMPAWRYVEDGQSSYWVKRDIQNPTDKATMGAMLDEITKLKPKSVKFVSENDVIKIYSSCHRLTVTSNLPYGVFNESKFTVVRQEALSIDNTDNEYRVIQNTEDYPYGYLFEITPTLTNEQMIFVANFDYDNQKMNNTVVQFFGNDTVTTTYNDNSYQGINVFWYDNKAYLPYYNIIKRSNDGVSWLNWYTFPSNYRILDVNFDNDKMIYYDTNDNKVKYSIISTDTLIYDYELATSLKWLYSSDRDNIYFTNTLNEEIFFSFAKNVESRIRLLSYSGMRLSGAIGLANSFFKNVYSDNYGRMVIGREQSNVINMDDSIYTDLNNNNVSMYKSISWNDYYSTTTGSAQVDNSDASSKEEDDSTDYDAPKNVFISSNIDVELTMNLLRTPSGIDWTASNKFNDLGESGTITPNNYSTFDIALTGIYAGIIISFNFIDAEIELDKRFVSDIEKRVLKQVSSIQKLVNLNASKINFKEERNLELAFPFLHQKNVSDFFDIMEDYFLLDGKLRKMLSVSITIDQLILFNENYSVFNIGEQRILIDDPTRYLNGYGFFQGSVIPFDDNRATFYIERVDYDFNNGKTRFDLIGI